MSYFPSRQSFQSHETDPARESTFYIDNDNAAAPDLAWGPIKDQPVHVRETRHTEPFSLPISRQPELPIAPPASRQGKPPLAEKAIQPRYDTRLLQDVSTTQSLVAALQATLEPRTTRPMVVIPGTRKRTSQTDPLPLSRRGGRRKSSRLRLSIVLGSALAFMLASLFSISTLNGGQVNIPVIGGVIQWVRAEQNVLNGAMAHTLPVAPAAQAAPPPPAMNVPNNNYVAIARTAATNAGIPPEFFVRQINAESGFNPNAYSPAGAVGIAQFLPSTAAGLGINPYDPVSALNGAAQYMARLYNQFGGDYGKALAAYNAGSGAVQRAVNLGGANWLAFMPLETQNYVVKIMG